MTVLLRPYHRGVLLLVVLTACLAGFAMAGLADDADAGAIVRNVQVECASIDFSPENYLNDLPGGYTHQGASFSIPLAMGPKTPEEEEKKAETTLAKELLLLVIGAAAIAWGANLLVDNGTIIAQALGVPDSVIGLTMVALGTSLPELITAITSLMKGHGALSLGNVKHKNP